MISRRFLGFLAVSGFAAAVNFASRFAFDVLVPYAVAIVLAYLVGMATAFVLNRRFVFTDAGRPLHHQAGWFVVVNVAAVLQTLVVSLLLARWALPALGWTWEPEAVAHAVGIAVPAVSSYFGHRWLTFVPKDAR
jgi:putative flippase GtrA